MIMPSTGDLCTPVAIKKPPKSKKPLIKTATGGLNPDQKDNKTDPRNIVSPRDAEIGAPSCKRRDILQQQIKLDHNT